MERRLLFYTSVLAAWLAFALPAAAQTRADCLREYTPQRAQEGKDVIWEPTEDSMVRPMLELAQITAADKVYDLGSGDGKLPIAAAKLFGATAVGIEYDPALVRHARCLAQAESVHARVTFLEGDIFAADFSDATVVAMYLTPPVLQRLQPALLALQPGTRVVSYSFGIGDWQPSAQVDSFGDGSAFLYVVPANVAGRWMFRAPSGDSFDVQLEQTYAQVNGAARGATVADERIAATVVRGTLSAEYVGTRHR